MSRLLSVLMFPLLAGGAVAAEPTMKPGLWELKTLKQVVDGKDMQAQMAQAQAQMQQQMAKMPPAQRKQMEQMMGSQGVGMAAGGAQRICISAEMAKRDSPMVDPEGRCEPSKLSRSGNKTSFEVNCTNDGRKMVGKGESTVTADLIATRMDMTTSDASGQHTMQMESQMKFLGADCGELKPIGAGKRK